MACSEDKFLEVLRLIHLVYHPPDDSVSEAVPSELLAAAEETASSAPSAALSVAPPTVQPEATCCLRPTDIGNFDIGFDISSHSDDNLDMSGDMFL